MNQLYLQIVNFSKLIKFSYKKILVNDFYLTANQTPSNIILTNCCPNLWPIKTNFNLNPIPTGTT